MGRCGRGSFRPASPLTLAVATSSSSAIAIVAAISGCIASKVTLSSSMPAHRASAALSNRQGRGLWQFHLDGGLGSLQLPQQHAVDGNVARCVILRLQIEAALNLAPLKLWR